MATLEERERAFDQVRERFLTASRQEYFALNRVMWNGLHTEITDEGGIMRIEKQCVTMSWCRFGDGYIAHDFDFQPAKLTGWTDWKEWHISSRHRHEYIELAYVYSGSFEQRIGEETYHYGPGDVWIIDQNCWHQDTVEGGDGYFIWLCINTEFFDRTFLEAIDVAEVQNFVKTALLDQRSRQRFLSFRSRSGRVKAASDALIGDILNELERDDIASGYIVRGLLLRLFQMLSREFDFELNETTRQTMDRVLLEQVDAYLREHYREVKLQDLVERFHFHEGYFNRLIVAGTGLTYTEYLQRLRLEESEQLLTETDLPVTDIAAQVGYNNMSYYYKIFKNKNGVTPKDYRDGVRR